MNDISFVCFLWDGPRDFRPEHVNLLAAGIKRHYRHPHRFICVTDREHKFSPDVEPVMLPEEAEKTGGGCFSPEGKHFPSSYRRLWAFSREAQTLGKRIMMLDIDCLVVGDPSPLLEYDADFVGWRPRKDWGNKKRVGGGTWLHRTGTLPHIWENFARDPIGERNRARDAGWRGSDQAIISHYLSDNCTMWPRDCGIYNKQDGAAAWKQPPGDAIIVHFNGIDKPWTSNRPWVKEALAA